MPDTADKTEKATPKKREDARKKGNVAKSMEVNTAAVLFTGTLALAFAGTSFLGNITSMMTVVFQNVADFEVTAADLRSYSYQGLLFLLSTLAPIVLSILVMGTTSNLLQVGFLITGEPLKPALKKISPMNGLKRLFSVRSLEELAKSVIKLTIVGLVIFVTIKGAAKNFVPLMDSSVVNIFSFLGTTMLKVALRASIAIIIMAALDYGFQRWEYEKKLRMSKQEVKEELKEFEGDPLMKSRIRGLQRQAARQRMMSEVPKADVVITNPIHYAVALKYDSDEMDAPLVVAKGARKLAEKIKEIANEHDVPIVENPILARSLYKMCELGMAVPTDLYVSIAEILAYVYGLKGKTN
ncbi:MAG: flagellar biosynthesis protein FlhB [bacterium]